MAFGRILVARHFVNWWASCFIILRAQFCLHPPLRCLTRTRYCKYLLCRAANVAGAERNVMVQHTNWRALLFSFPFEAYQQSGRIDEGSSR